MLDIKGMVRFAEAAYEGAIPEAVRAKARLRLADGLGCLCSGAMEPPGQLADRFITEERLSREGRASLLPGGKRTTPENAAWAHGMKIHAIDWDDWTFSLLHPTAITLPAALAIAEAQGASVKQLVNAFTVGTEVSMRIVRAVNPDMFKRGWHPSGSIGSIAAAVAAGLLLGHRGMKLRHSVALAMCQSAGMFANRGTMGKPFHVANISRAGTMAALAVGAGFDGSDDILDDKFGVGDTFLAGLPTRTVDWSSSIAWEIAGIWPIKLYPVGGSRQTLIAAALGARVALGAVKEGDIESITCRVLDMVLHIDHAKPASWLDSRFSHPYCVGVAVLDGIAGPKQFSAERFARGDVQTLMERVHIVADAALGSNPLNDGYKSIVEVKLMDGRHHTEKSLGIVGEDVSLKDIRGKVAQLPAAAAAAWDAAVGVLQSDQELVRTLISTLAKPA